MALISLSCFMCFFFIIHGSFAFRCDETRKCDDKYLAIRELSDLKFLPNQEQLLRLCPGILQFFECYFEQIQICMPLSITELAAGGHDFASEMLKTRKLISDICYEDSTLHKDYVANIDCIQDVTNAQSPVCKDNKKKLVSEFLQSRSAMEEIFVIKRIWKHQLCLEAVYAIACLSEDIHKNCGETARRVYLTVLEHNKIAVPSECLDEDDFIMKLEFLEYLSLNEEEKNVYWSVFQGFRR